MSHLDHDLLWSYAQGETPPVDVDAHLLNCESCRAQLDDVRMAQAALFALPEPPPLPAPVARRVGVALTEELDRRAARSLQSWWTRWLRPGFVFPALAVAAVIVAFIISTHQPTVTSPNPPVVAHVEPVPVGPVPSPLPETPRQKLTASVASARKARVTKAQVLSEGAQVATETGGSAWLRLPDGSRAGLTGNSQVTLSRLEPKTLTLEVAHGDLAMVVPHREERVLTVTAGDVTVKDLGTSFLVSRTPTRVLVAVEEGSVEVRTPASTQTVTAGHALTWHDGHVENLKWEPRPVEKVAPVVAPKPPPAADDDAVSTAARLREEDDDETPDPEPSSEPAPTSTGSESPEQWAQLPQAATNDSGTVAPPPTRRHHPGFSLSDLERRIHDLQRAIETPFGPSPVMRESRARDVSRLAGANDCVGALAIADRWLGEPKSKSDDEPRWRKAVLVQKLKCLNKLGRSDEADSVKLELSR